jgi:hypothetical protein
VGVEFNKWNRPELLLKFGKRERKLAEQFLEGDALSEAVAVKNRWPEAQSLTQRVKGFQVDGNRRKIRIEEVW